MATTDQPSNIPAALPQNSRIAIIGAGVAGLTAAHTLVEQGFSHITVYERENRVGGKVFSVRERDSIFEMGAVWVGRSYVSIENLAKKLGIDLVPDNLDIVIRAKSGKKLGMLDFFCEGFGPLALLRSFFSWQKVRKKFGYLQNPGSFLGPIHPHLTLPFAEFSRMYDIEIFAGAFRPFWVGCGYLYFETVPALYVLKLMLGRFNFSLGRFSQLLLPGHQGRGHNLRRIVDGYQTLWTRMAANIKDLRLSHPVQRIARRKEAGRTVISVTAQGKTDEFDAIIIATEVDSIKKFLDMRADERDVLSQVRSYSYVIHLFEAEGIQDYQGTMVLLDEYGSAAQIGHTTSLINRPEQPHMWTSGQLMPENKGLEDSIAILREDVAKLGGRLTEVKRSVVWNYLPHVTGEALQNGFYTKVNSLQGQQNTWFIGGLMNFESVEGTAAYALQLVAKPER